MNCKKCGKDNQENALYCIKCGKNLQLSGDNKKKRMTIFVSSLIVSLFVLICAWSVLKPSPIEEFNELLLGDKIAEALEVYNHNLKGSGKESEVETGIEDYVAKIQSDMNEKVISYDEAKDRLSSLHQLKVNGSTITEGEKFIERINTSKNNFLSGTGYMEEENCLTSLQYFKRVIKEDLNHSEAQKHIKTCKGLVEAQVISEIDEFIENEDYPKVVSLLTAALRETESNKLEEMLTKYSALADQVDKEEKQKVQAELELEQLIKVIDAKLVVQSTEYKGLYPDMIQVIIQNDSSETVKNYTVSIAAHDKNGFPVLLEQTLNLYGATYEMIGDATGTNITPGEKFGYDMGWSVGEGLDIHSVTAVVKEATFFNGDTWSNPYHSYWKANYVEVPLVLE